MTEEKTNPRDDYELEDEIDSIMDEEAVTDTIEAPPEADDIDLSAELDEWKGKAEEYLDGWQRARAEFANYKKRVERDQAQVYQNASGSVIKRYLDVLDDLELALKERPLESDGASWADGIELIYRKFISALEAEGVQAMEAQGQLFDPNLHEAVTNEDNPDFESGQIIEVVKQGYLIGDRVLRPAVVRVAR
ncbi:MAG: nucleotide exchange factor GrpE [Anaerolineales bacterium]|jgi:molecular chaperone GrpE